ncbi:UDP-N-acetylmuramate--L-alanine ligase [Sanguibacter gelidistatuariae]|uniref:UDP-N-acetylmuramate--L-alanine ligase n=1 Tax=Sanguibacter gelidistatuariae TaxID=1814289 RepID=A0A1G6NZX2_9MICO|nr:UDP-N-acetylmuramate--L-alanine ligase [Sanguibacter gelidistatuariae]SDC72747.1 UDP-N-acetylmuramate--L-alanine ligase [Sanguibacter gelidistatuariae]
MSPAQLAPQTLAELGTVHLVGVGGAGMSVVAQLLAARGLRVQGSDARRSAVTDALDAAGIRVWIGHDGAHVAGADTVVLSSAVRPENPELVAAQAAGLRVLHRSQALALLMVGARSVAVAGAHGKTTTSAMIAVTLRACGVDPSFAIGGSVLTDDGALPGGYSGTGDVLVAEADESDGSFLNYRPTIAVVTNVEPDHLDHYGSREAFEQAFVTFAGQIVPGGHLVACADDSGSAELVRTHTAGGGAALTYGTSAPAGSGGGSGAAPQVGSPTSAVISGYRIRTDPATGPAACTFTITLAAGTAASRDGEVLDVELAVSGEHNALNATAAVLTAILLGIEPSVAARAVGAFRGTGRRFESRGEVGGVRVVDDYAHHPTEVAAMLRAARGVVGAGRILVVFQPHLYSRTAIFAQAFADALELADLAVVCDVYAAREDHDPAVGPHVVVDLMATPGRGEVVADKLEAAQTLARRARPGDLLITVGAGDVTELGAVILGELAARVAAGDLPEETAGGVGA